MRRSWTLDQLATKPHFERAFDKFEKEQGRPIRLGPLPQPSQSHSYRMMLTVDGEPLLTFAFQERPPALKPGSIYTRALVQRREHYHQPGSVFYVALTILCEQSQEWDKRDWPQVFHQLQVPLRQLEPALKRGFEFDVNRETEKVTARMLMV